MTLLEALCGITIAASVAGYTLYQAEQVEDAVIEFNQQQIEAIQKVVKGECQ